MLPQSILQELFYVDSINALDVPLGGFDADVESADDIDEIGGVVDGLAGGDHGLDEMLDFWGAVEAAVGDGIDEGEGANLAIRGVGVPHLADEEDAFAVELAVAEGDVLGGAVVLVHFEIAEGFEIDDEEVSPLGDSAGDEGVGIDEDWVAEEEEDGGDESEDSPGDFWANTAHGHISIVLHAILCRNSLGNLGLKTKAIQCRRGEGKPYRAPKVFPSPLPHPPHSLSFSPQPSMGRRKRKIGNAAKRPLS
jgi:hypothetical protein